MVAYVPSYTGMLTLRLKNGIFSFHPKPSITVFLVFCVDFYGMRKTFKLGSVTHLIFSLLFASRISAGPTGSVLSGSNP